MFADVKGPSFIFWPVGCGDSTSVVISNSEVLQVDLNDTAIAEAEITKKSRWWTSWWRSCPRRTASLIWLASSFRIRTRTIAEVLPTC